MERVTSPLQKTLTKQQKSKKKQQPLRVVYITNPIKFKASASEFKALVQELTGHDANYTPRRGGEADGAAKAVGGGGAAPEVTKMERPVNGEVAEKEAHLDLVFGSGYDAFCNLQMIEDLQEMVGSNLLDVFHSLDAM